MRKPILLPKIINFPLFKPLHSFTNIDSPFDVLRESRFEALCMNNIYFKIVDRYDK